MNLFADMADVYIADVDMADGIEEAIQQQDEQQEQAPALILNLYNQLDWSPELGFHDPILPRADEPVDGEVDAPLDPMLIQDHCAIPQLPKAKAPTAADLAFTEMVDKDQERALQDYKTQLVESIGADGLNKDKCDRLLNGGFEKLYSMFASRIHLTDYPRHLWHLVPIRTSNPAIIRSSNPGDVGGDFITDCNPLRQKISEEHRADDAAFRTLLANQENQLHFLQKYAMECLMDEYNAGIDEALTAVRGEMMKRLTLKDKRFKRIKKARRLGDWTSVMAILELQSIESELYPGPGGILEAKYRACA